MTVSGRYPIVDRLTGFWRWLEWYPAPTKKDWSRQCWVGLGCVTLAVLLFCGYFCLYLTRQHLAYQTNAEDLGIMDQAVWSTLHGQVLHQTICNIVSDTNCAGSAGYMRFAIHVEPMLFLVSLFYVFFPNPITLLILQTIVVALGAYAAFLLARIRFQHTLLAVVPALLYLCYPALQQATVADFHAVTFTSTLLLFAIYFMYTRQTFWMCLFSFLAMICKEEIALVVVMLGLWSTIFQHRWRSGLPLAGVALFWFFLAVDVIMPHFSPTGYPLLLGRFSLLGNGPVQVALHIITHPIQFFQQYVFEAKHWAYIHILLIPAIFLPLCVPWITIIALPSLLLNLVSADSQMYSGLSQYNAEIVPVLIFSVIEAIVCITFLVQHFIKWFSQQKRPLFLMVKKITYGLSPFRLLIAHLDIGMTLLFLSLTLASAAHYDLHFHSPLPFYSSNPWPQITAHTALTNHFIQLVPADASVSAQSELVPHLSERIDIYLFPYENQSATYVLLDTTTDIYPFVDGPTYARAVEQVLATGQYGMVAQRDGLFLLKRGLSPPAKIPFQVLSSATRQYR